VDKGLKFFMSQAEMINKKIAPEEVPGFEKNAFLKNLGQFILMGSALLILVVSILALYYVGKSIKLIEKFFRSISD
jgi:hypothetical protein